MNKEFQNSLFINFIKIHNYFKYVFFVVKPTIEFGSIPQRLASENV